MTVTDPYNQPECVTDDAKQLLLSDTVHFLEITSNSVCKLTLTGHHKRELKILGRLACKTIATSKNVETLLPQELSCQEGSQIGLHKTRVAVRFSQWTGGPNKTRNQQTALNLATSLNREDPLPQCLVLKLALHIDGHVSNNPQACPCQSVHNT